MYVLEYLETNKEVQEAGLLDPPDAADIPDFQAGTQAVPFELDEELEHLDDMPPLEAADMPELEEELPPGAYLVREESRAEEQQEPPPLDQQNPKVPPPLSPRRSARGVSRKKTITEELNCKFLYFCKYSVAVSYEVMKYVRI